MMNMGRSCFKCLMWFCRSFGVFFVPKLQAGNSSQTSGRTLGRQDALAAKVTHER